jgi:hypothetical protein
VDSTGCSDDSHPDHIAHDPVFMKPLRLMLMLLSAVGGLLLPSAQAALFFSDSLNRDKTNWLKTSY